MAIIKVERELEVSSDDSCTILTCEVEVEVEPAEKGYGECPDYPATASVYSITCKGIDLLPLLTEEAADALAKEIAKEAEEEGNEARMERTLSMRMAA